MHLPNAAANKNMHDVSRMALRAQDGETNNPERIVPPPGNEWIAGHAPIATGGEALLT